jgi:hypothetical protein
MTYSPTPCPYCGIPDQTTFGYNCLYFVTHQEELRAGYEPPCHFDNLKASKADANNKVVVNYFIYAIVAAACSIVIGSFLYAFYQAFFGA